MSNTEAALAARREALRDQLRNQREQIATQLEADNGEGYPRSITMRFILKRPALVIAIASWLVGARWAGRARGLLLVVRTLALAKAVVPAVAGPVAARPVERAPPRPEPAIGPKRA